MACGKCGNCGSQMEEESVYGSKVCRCPDCGWKTKAGTGKPAGLNYKNTPKVGGEEGNAS